MDGERQGLIEAMLSGILGDTEERNGGITVNITVNAPVTLIVRPEARDRDLVRMTTARAANER